MPSDPYARMTAVPSFRVSSSDMRDGDYLKNAQLSKIMGSSLGMDMSPAFSWQEAPKGSRSFTITAFDADGPSPSGFWHWVLVDVPGKIRDVPSGVDPETLGHSYCLKNDVGLSSYVGPAPSALSGEHNIYFTVHALDIKTLGLAPGSTPAAAFLKMNNHTLARATLVAKASTGSRIWGGMPPM